MRTEAPPYEVDFVLVYPLPIPHPSQHLRRADVGVTTRMESIPGDVRGTYYYLRENQNICLA